MRHPRAIGALALLLAGTLAACGGDDSSGSPASDGETVEVVMRDNEFDPATITVAAGAEVTFRFRNEGKLRHEGLIGSADVQEEHAADMAEGSDDHDDGEEAMDGMDHDESEAPAVTVEPGATGEITHRFTEAGEVLIGCHEPGHYQAGMKATVEVA